MGWGYLGHRVASVTPRQFAKRLEHLADSMEDLCQEMAEETLELIDQEFDTDVDPRGVGWAPRKGRRTNPLLEDTGDFRGNFGIFEVNKAGYTIANYTPYAGYLQRGTERSPARRTVPGSGEGLGRWGEPLQKIARDFIKHKLDP